MRCDRSDQDEELVGDRVRLRGPSDPRCKVLPWHNMAQEDCFAMDRYEPELVVLDTYYFEVRQEL